ncbi:MAG: nitrate reductase molybdenum cofactor assembly chaperone, partial [Mycobacteriales bacterium]
MSMVADKMAYRRAGFTPTEDELPDYLPMVLDFAAHSDQGVALLRVHRADLELLLRALRRAETPYVDVLGAVCAQLPRLGRRDMTRVAEAWEKGPPVEEVGLEPFAPPDYLTGSVSR